MKSKLIAILYLFIFVFSACDDSQKEGEFVDEPLVLKGDDNYTGEQCGPEIYPCPPYGTSKYQTIRNIAFLPANQAASDLVAPSATPSLKAFYQLREEGYQLLLITLSTGWCDVCLAQMQAVVDIVPEYSSPSTQPRVAFLTIITEDEQLETATLEYASQYSTDHGLDELVPVTNDPNKVFYKYMTSSSYPFNIFINLKDMTIVDYATGLDTEAAFAQKLDEVLELINPS